MKRWCIFVAMMGFTASCGVFPAIGATVNPASPFTLEPPTPATVSPPSPNPKATKALRKALDAHDWVFVKRYIEEGKSLTTCIPHARWYLGSIGKYVDKPYCPNLLDYLVQDRKVDLLILAVRKGAYGGHVQGGLDMAAAENMPRLAKLFLSMGAEINPDLSNPKVASQVMWPPLVTATSSNSLAVAKILIAAGADVNYADADEQGFTPLGNALESGNEEMADLLVRSGAKLNMRSTDGWTLMEVAAERHFNKYISILAQFGFDLNATDTAGETPLLAAISPPSTANEGKTLETVKLLLKLGANPCHRDTSGKTALDYALKFHLSAVVKTLKPYDSRCVSRAVQPSHVEGRSPGQNGEKP